ncbi:unnamed protein product [Mytilus edulis]|uniref:B box-type domain-containing protein n=1 Tax=Mytilus edulis TaxID=6550 RepID=A0A8S3R996_MYTED|nr:unnamed protein product [Mytilus edulis]
MHTLTMIAHNPGTVKDGETCKKKDHENGRLNFFCRSSKCQKILCATCAITEHWSHEVEDINLTFHNRRESVQQLLDHLKKKVVFVKKLEQRSKTKVDNLLNQSNKYNEKVQLASSKGMQSVYDKAHRVIERVKTSQKENMIHLHKAKEKYSVYLANATECCNTIEQLLRTASALSFFTLEQFVKENLQHFLNIEIEKIEIQGTNHTKELDALVYAYEDFIEKFQETTLDPVPEMHFVFDTSENSFPCRSYDSRTVSTRPYSGLICKERFFKNQGIYGNIPFKNDQEYKIDIVVRIEDLQLGNDEQEEPDEKMLFEIGLTDQKIHMLYLYENKEHTWAVYGTQRGDGVCVRYNDRIESCDLFLKGDNISGLWEVHFSLWFQPEKENLLIISNFSTYSFTNISGTNPLWPVYAIYYNNSLASITIVSSSPPCQTFQKSTVSAGFVYNSLVDDHDDEDGNIVFVYNYDYKQNISTYNIDLTDGSSAIFVNTEGVSSIVIRVIVSFNATASNGRITFVSASGIPKLYIMSYEQGGLGTFPQFFIRKRCTFCTPDLRVDMKRLTLFDLKVH